MGSKVLLIYPPNQLMPVELARFDGSLGPLYLAAALEREGIETDVLDANVGTAEDRLEDTFDRRVTQDNGLIRMGMSDERLFEAIARGGYSVVGVTSNFTPQTKMALAVVRVTKAVSKDILVIAGGVNARSLAGRFLAAGADVICATEGERVIVNILQAWRRGKSLATVSGTITLHGGQLYRNCPQASDTLIELDRLPIPAWEKLPFKQYDRAAAAGRDSLEKRIRSASLMTSRGCPFQCKFCHISIERAYAGESGWIGKLRFKSVDRVMREVGHLKTLGVSKIFFEDDSLLAKKERVREIFTRVRGLGMQIADVNGVNLVHFLTKRGTRYVIDEEYLELLASAGFTQIVFPVESASQRILDTYATGKLHHGRLDVVELVRLAVSAGITCPINMMIGFPDETEAEMRASIELGRKLVDAGAPYCSLYIPIPFPGSRLFEIASHGGHLEPDFDTDLFNWRRPVMKNTVVLPARIEELQREGWETINPPEYVRARLAMRIGPRWKSGKPEVAEAEP